MKQIIQKEIVKTLNREVVLEKPKDKNLAHYATPLAFSMAKELKKSPKVIAEDIVKDFKDSKVFNITSLNGYINFRLKESFLNEISTKYLKAQNDFAKSEDKNSSILLEYVSANPTGPLHIGHTRGAVYGDTLARVGIHVGYDIATEYYINDAGNQIELLGLSIYLVGREKILGLDTIYPENFYKGEYIEDLAKEAYKEFGKEIFLDEKNSIKLSSWGKDKMIDVIKNDLSLAHIAIDNWVSEKSLYSKLDNILEKLKKSNGIYEKDGKIWLNSSKLNDEKDRVIVKEDGNGAYLAGDIIYHDDKFQRNFDHYINIWGADHHGYIQRVKASLHFLGYDENRLEVILAQMVSLLKNGEAYKMSKRAGNFILMSDVLEEIGSDALRFVFISKKCDTPLEFDINELKAEDSSNPIFYINYAHARVHQVFAKAEKNLEDVVNASFENLNEDAKNLLFEALILNDVLEDAFHSRQLQKLPDYLKSLSSNFHKFYNENKVVGSANEDALLKVFAVVAMSIRTGLSLMGITAKDKMHR
ncbi:arginyl-tRNA synthetase [Campylobacter blaseri]|uniref:Arginine--tRNA ligase n=1 Tax=Campylobacter blaseri TaxID=2042961 RepID=A0A2P8R0L6_9BACT|nr:arginine--tRNA ligase [Campylobacter blaseri]PSM52043.1 arginine--tRNA ligase [Campylobacter blaseri]PSM53828.1 arginine--tRNA ligase [Campylobacter blaseri]QKF85620.1 arginyl-tRNA synthetase [Campylobacter blaseri]